MQHGRRTWKIRYDALPSTQVCQGCRLRDTSGSRSEMREIEGALIYLRYGEQGTGTEGSTDPAAATGRSVGAVSLSATSGIASACAVTAT